VQGVAGSNPVVPTNVTKSPLLSSKVRFCCFKGLFFDTPNIQQSCHSLPEHIIEEEWLPSSDLHLPPEQIFLHQAPDEKKEASLLRQPLFLN
jgi:hypothetical protein